MRNYNEFQNFYTEHPKKDHRNATRSLHFANYKKNRGGTTPTPIGDNNTWESTSVRCHVDAGGDPPLEEEQAREADVHEHDRANHLVENRAAM